MMAEFTVWIFLLFRIETNYFDNKSYLFIRFIWLNQFLILPPFFGTALRYHKKERKKASQTDRQTHGQTDRQKDRQTDRKVITEGPKIMYTTICYLPIVIIGGPIDR